jgi:hypothetical protein
VSQSSAWQDKDPRRERVGAESNGYETARAIQYQQLPSSFTVSPDGRTILYGRLVRDEADLMLIENFK